jgi:carbamoyltransferase
LQEALEEIVFHILTHFQKQTGHKKLCLAGGVAHNCTLNGKILYSGLFEDVFVQPAAHDAGCALGAALVAYHKERPAARPWPLEHVYLGSSLSDDDTALSTLSRWRDFLEFEKVDNVAQRTADLLAEGSIVGWVQGRSEFGPRALGNRSILADPRPPENKDIINEMVKKREGFRPFAPSVLDEHLTEYFDVPETKKQLPFMIFVVKVRKDMQKLLGAVTHVDGTARVQSVSRETNSRFWDLINEFGNRTGVYVLLNTSFNNNVEPIVDSESDAIVCFLTTKIHCLVLGNYMVKKKDIDYSSYLPLIPSLALYARMYHTRRFVSADSQDDIYEIGNTFNDEYRVSVSSEIFHLLTMADGKRPLGELLDAQAVCGQQTKSIVEQVIQLWSKRLVLLSPPEATGNSPFLMPADVVAQSEHKPVLMD